ncbi:ROK family protein [Pseudoclavibacter terrae]
MLAGMGKSRATKAIGIDIGGTGIKGALVDLQTGELLSKRRKVPTPVGGDPREVIEATMEIVRKIWAKDLDGDTDVPVGISVPAIVKHGVTRSAANISPLWINFAARAAFSEAVGREVALANDADAAGIAEVRFGVAHGRLDSVIMTTLGTGIGTAMFYGGHLFPNSELGHIGIGEHSDYEKYASSKVREREELSFAEWGARLTPYYRQLEALFSPDVFIVSGGISKQADEFLHYIDVETPIVVAEFMNNAGIVGSACLAAEHWV